MPIGPELVTADEVDVSDLALTTTLNGQVMQSARTSQMIVDVPSAIEFFSSFTRLAPGDVIATSTPGGVGFTRQPPVWLEPGDTIEITRESIRHPQQGGSLKKATTATGGGGQVARRPPVLSRIHSSNAVIEVTAMFDPADSAASAAGNEGHRATAAPRMRRLLSFRSSTVTRQ